MSVSEPIFSNTANIVSAISKHTGANAQSDRNADGQTASEIRAIRFSDSTRTQRYILQSAARDILPGERVWNCLRTPAHGAQQVEIIHSRDKGRARYGGLQTCGSVWHCAVCAAKISERRRALLTACMARNDFHPLLVTLTVRHDVLQPLSGLLAAVSDAWRNMKRVRAWRSFCDLWGLQTYVTAKEVTHGERGWHPHLHGILFFDDRYSVENIRRMQQDLSEMWLHQLGKIGHKAHEFYGADVRNGEDCGFYVSKWGIEHEVTKAVVKKGRASGRTPVQILRDWCDYERTSDRRLWHEYAINFKGRKQLEPAKNFRKLMHVEQIQSDLEAAMDIADDDYTLAVLTLDQWRTVRKRGLRSHLLDVADSGDWRDVVRFLRKEGIQ